MTTVSPHVVAVPWGSHGSLVWTTRSGGGGGAVCQALGRGTGATNAIRSLGPRNTLEVALEPNLHFTKAAACSTVKGGTESIGCV